MMLIAIFMALAMASADLIELSSDNFAQHVDGSSNVLVEFFAPWCGHCKNLAPEWKLAAETFQAGDPIKIAAVDATAANDLASKFGVKGYPTIKFFPKGSTEPEDYTGGRTADTIVKWVNDKVGTSRKVRVPASAVTALTSETFDAAALGSKAALVEFYAPWCGHCKSLAPEYEKVAKAFAGENDVVIAKVDATEEGELANRFEVQGYPTLKFFPAGSAEPEDYQGERSAQGIVDFINDKVGTQRGVDGSLAPTAGRVEALDQVIAAAQYKVTSDVLSQLKTLADGLEGKEAGYGKTYVSIGEKALAKGGDYVVKEIGRVTSMLNSASIKPQSKGQFQLKLNILRAFAAATNDEL